MSAKKKKSENATQMQNVGAIFNNLSVGQFHNNS